MTPHILSSLHRVIFEMRNKRLRQVPTVFLQVVSNKTLAANFQSVCICDKKKRLRQVSGVLVCGEKEKVCS